MKTKKLIVLLALVTGLVSMTAKAGTPSLNSNYVYQNQALNLTINMPDAWQGKVKVTETDQSVSFSYTNTGGSPIFLYSVTKVNEQTWLNIKDQLQNVHVVANKNGVVYFVQLTDKTSIKGANAAEFKTIVDQLNDVMHSVQIS